MSLFNGRFTPSPNFISGDGNISGSFTITGDLIVLGSSSFAAMTGVIDHGMLMGLLDDDHPQYLPIDGSRGMSGSLNLNNNSIINLATPISGTDAATKDYVDSVSLGLDWQESVLDKDLSTPPGSPSVGDRYIIASVGAGAWSGQDDNIGEWNGASWDFSISNEGFASWVEDENVLYVYNGSSWVKFGSTVDHGNLIGLGDDDHIQYLLIDGTRSMTGSLDMGSNNIVSVGLVDGRNVSIDGTTLDSHVANFSNPHSSSLSNLGTGSLSELNALITDAALDDSSASRAPTGSAGGDLSGSYPNPAVVAITLDDLTRLMVNGIDDGEVLVRSGSIITGTSSLPIGMADHGLLTGLGDDDHLQYQLRSELNLSGGYTGLDALSKISGSFITYGSSSDTAAEGNDIRLSDDRDPNLHGLADPTRHSGSTLAELNTLITDATLGDITTPHTPIDHGLGSSFHTASTLAELNALVSDATLDDSSASRTPTGSAGGDLSGSYPNPEVTAVTSPTGSGTQLSIGVINDGETLVRSGSLIISSGEISGRRDYGVLVADPIAPVPTDGDKYYNSVINMEMLYDASRSKWLSVDSNTFEFGRNGNTAPGSYYRGIDGRTFTSGIGYNAFNSGTIVGISFTRSDTDAAVFEITSGGIQIEFLSSSATSGFTSDADGDFSPGVTLGVRNKTGLNTTTNVLGWVKAKWRA